MVFGYVFLAGFILLAIVGVYLLVDKLMSFNALPSLDLDDEEPEVEPVPAEVEQTPVPEMILDPVSGFELQGEGSLFCIPIPDSDQAALHVRVNNSTLIGIVNVGLRSFAADLRYLRGSDAICLIMEHDALVRVPCGEVYNILFGAADFNEQLDRIDAALKGDDILEGEAEAQPEEELRVDPALTMAGASDLLPVPKPEELAVPERIIAAPEPLEDPADEELAQAGSILDADIAAWDAELSAGGTEEEPAGDEPADELAQAGSILDADIAAWDAERSASRTEEETPPAEEPAFNIEEVRAQATALSEAPVLRLASSDDDEQTDQAAEEAVSELLAEAAVEEESATSVVEPLPPLTASAEGPYAVDPADFTWNEPEASTSDSIEPPPGFDPNAI